MKKEKKGVIVTPLDEKENYWNTNATARKYLGKLVTPIPLAGILIEAFLLKAGWNTVLWDENIRGKLDENNPDFCETEYIFVTGMIVHKQRIEEILNLCNRYNKKTVVGGPLVTSQPDLFKEKITHTVCYDANPNLIQLLRDIENGDQKPLYNSRERPNLDDSPIPSYKSINWINTFSALWSPLRDVQKNANIVL